jgi:uncharacterized protein (TIGR00255 family)
MPLLSMTGYGRASMRVANTDLTVEINAVNRRGLEVFVSGPEEWTGLERIVTPWVREKCERGKIAVTVRAQTGGAESVAGFSWDREAVATTLRRLEQEAHGLDVAFKADEQLLLRLAELHKTRREGLPALDDEAVQAAFRKAVDTALDALVAMRVKEGRALEKDMSERIAILAGLAENIRVHAADNVARYRDAMFARLRQSGLELNLDDERVLKEIALFADRCDIVEELTRLASHFAQFTSCFGEKAVGRKLDFLCQEINREFNTVGSKANRVEITRAVIEAKNELERIREQVQNLE